MGVTHVPPRRSLRITSGTRTKSWEPLRTTQNMWQFATIGMNVHGLPPSAVAVSLRYLPARAYLRGGWGQNTPP